MSGIKPAVAPAPIDYAALAKEMPTPGAPAAKPVENKPAAPVPVAGEPATETPAENKPAAPVEGTPFAKGFAQLTKAQADFRAEREAAKHGLSLARVVTPVQAAALEKAMSSNDPVGAMQALGYSYADIANRLAAGGKPAAPVEKPAEKPEDKKEAAPLSPEVEEMLASHRAAKAQQQSKAIIDGIKGVVEAAADKFKMVTGLQDFEGVRKIIDGLWDPEAKAFVGNLSGLEVIQVAAEEYERRLSAGEVSLTKAQWDKLQNLTPAATSASTTPEATRERPGNAPVSAAKTLTNRTGASQAPVAARPATPDYDALARELP